MQAGAEAASRVGWLNAHAYAHRGMHGRDIPENSLAAFRAAMASGLGIECDIRKSADGRAMVFHDRDLARMTGSPGRLGKQTVGTLTRLTLSGSAETIPTLLDLVRLVAGQVPLLLELKTERDRPVAPLCRAVRRDLEGYPGDVAVMSFDPRVSRWFAVQQPRQVRGLVVTEKGRRTLADTLWRLWQFRQARPEFIAYDIRDLPSRFAAARARAGLPLLSWTVRTPAQLETALASGASPILEGAGVAAWRSRD